MRIRFQADADLDARIVRGIRRRRPEIDFRLATTVIPDAMPDPDVLLLAAKDNRVLVSADASTMPSHFIEFISEQESPGLIVIPRTRGLRKAIEDLLYAWEHAPAELLRNHLLWPSDLYKHF